MTKQAIWLLFWTCVFILALTTAGCSSVLPVNGDDLQSPTLTPSPEEPPTEEPCAFMWASKNLEKETAALMESLGTLGFEGLEARAEAFGENCVTASGKNMGFGIMQVDIFVSIPLKSLEDRQEMGRTTRRVLETILALPEGTFHSPNPGYVDMRFFHESQEYHLRFLLKDGKQALDEGLDEEALINKFRKE